MRENNIYLSRYQIPSDAHLRQICQLLKKEGIIHKYFVCRFHFTNMLIKQDDRPIQLRDENDLLNAFEGSLFIERKFNSRRK